LVIAECPSRVKLIIITIIIIVIIINHRALLWASSSWSPRQAGEEPAFRAVALAAAIQCYSLARLI